MMRALIALTVLTAVCLACASSARAQVGYDRRGHDYMNFSVRSGDQAVCAARCDREARSPPADYDNADRTYVVSAEQRVFSFNSRAPVPRWKRATESIRRPLEVRAFRK